MRAIGEGFSALCSAILRMDLRAWFVVGMFALVWRIIELIADRPELLENASFMQLIGPLCGAGGILLVASFLFGANKDEAAKTKALADNAATLREAGLPVGSHELRARGIDIEGEEKKPDEH